MRIHGDSQDFRIECLEFLDSIRERRNFRGADLTLGGGGMGGEGGGVC